MSDDSSHIIRLSILLERPLSEPKHYPWLDWMRFLAAMMVVMVHARQEFHVEFGRLPAEQKTPVVAAFFSVTRLGNEAVIVFFVLSGYLVAGKGIERLLQSRFNTTDYGVDRFARVYLPYIPALLLTWICSIAVGTHPAASTFLWNVFCLQGVFDTYFGINGPLWTIAYEVWFYVLLGSVGGFLEFQNTSRIRTALALIGIILSLAVFTVLSSTYLFCWMIGAMAYFYRQADWKISAIALVVVIYAVIGIQLRVNATVSVNSGKWLSYFPSAQVCQLIMATCVAAIISQLVTYQPRSSLTKRFEHLGTILASFSYSLYLTHNLSIRVALAAITPTRYPEISVMSLGSMFAGCCLAFTVAYVMYLLFERHTARFKRWIRRMVFRQVPSDARGKSGSPQGQIPTES